MKKDKQDIWVKKGKMYYLKTDDFKQFITTLADLWVVCDKKDYNIIVTVKKSKKCQKQHTK